MDVLAMDQGPAAGISETVVFNGLECDLSRDAYGGIPARWLSCIMSIRMVRTTKGGMTSAPNWKRGTKIR